MPTEVKVPELGDGISSGDVLSVLVSEGDQVEVDQDIVELETDKAVAPVPSTVAGKVVKVLVKEGESVSIGATLIEVEGAEAESESASSDDDDATDAAAEDAAAEEDEAPADDEAEAADESDNESDEQADEDSDEEAKPASSGDDGEEQDVVVPELGDGIEAGDVLNVLVEVGDEIDVEQGIVELETDKAVAEVPSTLKGKVTEIHVKQGDTAKVGGKLITVAVAAGKKKQPAKKKPAKKEAAEKKETAKKKESPKKNESPKEKESQQEKPKVAKAEPATATADRGDGDSNGQTAPAGPAVRRFARELGIDLTTVQGTGPHGRITKEDVRASVRQLTKAATSQESATRPAPRDAGLSKAKAPSAASDVDKWGPVRRERLTKIRKTIAAKMVESSTTIPHLTNFDDADVTELEKIRQASKEDYAASGVKLTSMPFVIKAVASALLRHPVVNASLDMESGEVIYKDYVNIGIAVDTDRGLVVPALRNVDQLGIPQIAHGLSRIADMARDANFAIEDLRGGTFTISNLGAIGGTYSTPIINAPEVAILLVGRSRMLPMVVDGEIEPRLVMPLSLSYDHRLVDGAAAARFLNDVKGYLQAPGRLLLAP